MVLPGVSYAQQLRRLPLQEAIMLAHKHSNQLSADSLQYRIAQTHVSQASANALPQINLSSSYQRLSNNITPFSISLPSGSFQLNQQILNQSFNAVQLTQLLFSGGKLTYDKQAFKKEAAAAKSDYEKNVLELDHQVTDLWFNLYNATASQKIILANIEALSKKRDDLETFRVQGLVLDNDVLKIELSITNLRSNLADISSLAGSLNYNLCLTTGIDPTTTIEIPDDYLHTLTAIEPLQNYISSALTKRAELKSYKYRSEAAAYRIKAVRADYFPTINLIGNYNYDKPNQRVIPSVDKFNYSAYAGVNLAWRLSSFYTNRTRVSESKLVFTQLNNNLQQTTENIQIEVNTKYLEYKKTLEKITLAQTELEQATENFRVEQNKLNAQTTTPTDFLDANTKMLQSQLNLATAKANVELAYRKLIKSTGETAN
ncbi:TolC family protein [Chitinophaga sp. CF118]|uniref:TolC family protein n=1 Tax=Chitinophaga sp. CF118 TaxID=1884367 RepID=UPI002101ACBA|nr:TolC family protein [Chitinophaga sp. CF118]